MKRIIGLLALIFTLCLSLPAMADTADSLPAGFIAIAPGEMSWNDAKAFCQQQGGRLPLIGGSNSLGSVSKGTLIDGFGTVSGPWPAGLPSNGCWADTENSNLPSYSWIVVKDYGGSVNVGNSYQSYTYRAVCVP